MMRPTLLVLVAIAALAVSPARAAQEAPPAPPSSVEHLVEVRIHGNHTTPDAEVLRIAGLTVGDALDAAAMAAARDRLVKSGRFEEVDVRKRYRSLEPGGDVALIIVVLEHAVPDAMPGSKAARPFRRLFASGMFLPIVSYADGYGFTYGARFSFVDLIGRGSRISVPLSWGGTRRAAIEIERTFRGGPFDRVLGGAAAWQRTNPFYEIDERRNEVWIEGSRQLVKGLRAAGRAGYGHVRFGALEENTATYGADLTLDTRLDPVFPRNAVYASAGLERLAPSSSMPVNRVRGEVRGYAGLFGQAVLSLRVQYAGADGPQPAYARYLLGGAGTLRGYKAGSFSGDNLLAGSVELRVPVSSPMNLAKAGFTLFADAGSVWDHGERLRDASFTRGAGVGFFVLASLFQVNLDVGFREGWGSRVHFTTGLQF
jgi:outer membrane protein assembly factor BamA